MNFFQKIFSFLWGQKGIKDTSIDSSKSEFILVDSNKIKNILNIDKEAEGLGKMDSPSTNSKPPDATEEKVHTYLKSIEGDEANKFTARSNAYQRSMNVLSADLDLEKLEKTRREHVNSASNRVDIGVNHLYSLKKQFTQSHERLVRFKKENKLNRPPNEQGNNTLLYGFLSVIFLLESILNASFFASAGEEAYLTSGGYALMLSLLNIGLSFAFGKYFLPYKNSIHTHEVVRTWFFTIVFIVLILAINLLATNLREVLEMQKVDLLIASQKAISDFTFTFGSIWSYAFIVLGLSMSGLAAHKGYNSDDPYPHYGRVSRHTELLEEEMADYYEELMTELKDNLGGFNDTFRSTLDDIGNRRERFATLNNNLINLQNRFSIMQLQIASVYASVVSDYRSTNKLHRKTKEPAYFNKKPFYEKVFNASEQIDKNTINSIDSTIKKAKTYLPKLIKQCDLDYTKLSKQIPSLESLIKGNKNG